MKIRTEGVSWQEIDGELVILDLQSSAYLTTNRSGALLAKLLTEDRQLDELVDALVGTYGIDRDAAMTDATAFVEALQTKNLLATL